MDEMRRDALRQIGLLLLAIPACSVEASEFGLLAQMPVSPSTSAFTRSRNVPLPRIIKQPKDLIAAKLVLPFDRSVARDRTSYPTYTYKPGAWSEVGLSPDMGGTGERQEIGLVTDAIASWLTGGSPNSMLAQAEAHGTSPVHYRHKNGVPSLDGSGAAVDINDPKCKYASSYDNRDAVHANPWFDMGNLYTGGAKVRTDTSHYPNLCYVPYLATGDLYYLQEVQDAATYAIIWGNPEYRGFEKGLITDGQTRAYAWCLNLIASAYIATKEAEKTAPMTGTLFPSSYWKRILDNNCAEFERRWVKNGDNRAIVAGCHFAVAINEGDWRPWQQDMLGFVMGWMVYTGQFPEWRGNYEWHMQQAIMRSSGKHGFPRSQGAQYEGKVTGVTDMASYARINGWAETSDGNAPATADPGYLAYLRGNLKVAVLNGIAGASEVFTYADSQSKRRNLIYLKWAV